MCGVIGLVYERDRDDLGRIAADLLRMLEYRGYDSTGGAFQGDSGDIVLRKGVGAPSDIVDRLGITAMAGRVFCGQVRWATFGAVTDANAQPHVVGCRPGVRIYGAHNGNVTNCDELHAWLTAEGHAVASDNDGEMIVHAVEHFFAPALEAAGAAAPPGARRAAMRAAVVSAATRIHGSFAAVIVDPVTRALWAVKQGSSLHVGVGTDATGGRFVIASSDLSSVLKLTRVLVPIVEGEFVEYDHAGWDVYALARRSRPSDGGSEVVIAGTRLPRTRVRTRLRAADAALTPPFETFMDQEISAQAATVEDAVTAFFGGTEAARAVPPPADRDGLNAALQALFDASDEAASRRELHAFSDRPEVRAWREAAPAAATADVTLRSAEAGVLTDLLPMARAAADVATLRLVDAWLYADEISDARRALARAADLCVRADTRCGRVYAICCGSSFHAAKAGALFFHDIAGVELIPLLPGEFRGQTARTLRDDDVIVAVSQSGETKDLIDVLDDVIEAGRRVARVAIVNNVNSTIAQEKSDIVVPLRCGPEIAVPATKSFMSQLVAFYMLALAVGERRGPADRARHEAGLDMWQEQLRRLPALIRETVATTDAALDEAAAFLHLRPSLHLLATRMAAVAFEGALKIREVVLNHAEGFEASEFKHGPNTILGYNTIFGPEDVARALAETGGDEPGRARLARAIGPASRADADYPLIYVTGPDERDVALTVSQINTHKIRGASSIVIAEEHAGLRGAAAKAPADNPRYRWAYIPLPATGYTLMAVFTATVALQRLALKMSLRKRAWLDALGVVDHGVDPDAPKNASKSITVD